MTSAYDAAKSFLSLHIEKTRSAKVPEDMKAAVEAATRYVSVKGYGRDLDVSKYLYANGSYSSHMSTMDRARDFKAVMGVLGYEVTIYAHNIMRVDLKPEIRDALLFNAIGTDPVQVETNLHKMIEASMIALLMRQRWQIPEFSSPQDLVALFEGETVSESLKHIASAKLLTEPRAGAVLLNVKHCRTYVVTASNIPMCDNNNDDIGFLYTELNAPEFKAFASVESGKSYYRTVKAAQSKFLVLKE